MTRSSERAGMRATVIGAGAWGTAIASLLAGKAETTVWARETEVADAIDTRHENPLFMAGISLTPTLHASNDLATSLTGAEVVLMAVPSAYYRECSRQPAQRSPTTRRSSASPRA